MSEDDSISYAKIYARIPADLDEALRVACARARISKPKGIALALEAWLAEKAIPKPGDAAIAETSDYPSKVGTVGNRTKVSIHSGVQGSPYNDAHPVPSAINAAQPATTPVDDSGDAGRRTAQKVEQEYFGSEAHPQPAGGRKGSSRGGRKAGGQ